MKKHHLSKEEFSRLEYEFNETKDNLPHELVEAVGESFDFFRPFITCELPLREELEPAIEKLMYKHYPMSNFTAKWQKDWIREVAVDNADLLGISITNLFTCIETGKALAVYDDLETMIRVFIKPKVPYVSTMAEYKDWNLTEEQKVRIQENLDESNEFEIEISEEINRLKAAYINAVQPLILSYFGYLTDDMSLEKWNHYGIVLGSAFIQFNEHCLELLDILETKNSTEFQDKGFFNYKYKGIQAPMD